MPQKSPVGKPSYRALLKLIRKEATAELQCLPEDTEIEGNACAIDEDTDRATEHDIRSQLAAGNEWAWCCACVEITWRGHTEREFLGCCSYKSEADFVACGERETMRDEACIRLAHRLHGVWSEIGAAISEAS